VHLIQKDEAGIACHSGEESKNAKVLCKSQYQFITCMGSVSLFVFVKRANQKICQAMSGG
jgi:hypothetical protein